MTRTYADFVGVNGRAAIWYSTIRAVDRGDNIHNSYLQLLYKRRASMIAV